MFIQLAGNSPVPVVTDLYLKTCTEMLAQPIEYRPPPKWTADVCVDIALKIVIAQDLVLDNFGSSRLHY